MEEGTRENGCGERGDAVTRPDHRRIETDQGHDEFEAVDEGTVGKILISEGTRGQGQHLIAVLLEEGEDASAAASAAEAPKPAPAAQPQAARRRRSMPSR